MIAIFHSSIDHRDTGTIGTIVAAAGNFLRAVAGNLSGVELK